LLLSVAYDSSIACTDIINELMECTNSEYVFSQGKLKLIPYWDNLPAQYAITGKDVFDQDEDTLLIERTSEADIYNVIPLEHLSRANDYNVNMVYASDEGNIELNGVKQAGTYTHHGIMTPQLAQAVAQIILQKQLYNRNKYTIRVGQEFILLEPMDTCTLELELAGLGLTTVRVVSIKENADDLSLDITFEDNGPGVSGENLDKLFTPNFTTKSGGTGLGLAICRNIIEKCEGEICYQKSFVLGGASFVVSIPKLKES
jgi:hypothetical protein